MLPAELIRAKRDGATLQASQLEAFVRGLVDGSWSDAQVGAFAMAVVCRGMSAAETVALTRAMTHSGTVIDWRAGTGRRALRGPIVDKHSTGGIGDKVSLMLAPIVAACGGIVPMVSGRGLGHTGGTLDKLESLAGYRVDPSAAQLHRALLDAGCAIVGAGPRLAPADRRLYAIRDVTATVESVPLITASILSKKLAAGVEALVMDVKVGSGAFCRTLDDARALARTLVSVAAGAGVPTEALVTDMNQVLGRHAGNALEVREAIEFLRGDSPQPRLTEVTLALSARLLQVSGIAADPASAFARYRDALESGEAAERFARMVAALGGPRDVLGSSARSLPRAPVVIEAPAGRAGLVRSIDVRRLGLVVVQLGGGRVRPGDRIDPRVGLADVKGVGERVAPGEPLCLVHAARRDAAEQAAREIAACFEIGDAPDAPAASRAVIERVTGS